MLGVFRYGGRALGLVWSTSRTLSVAFGVLTLVAGLLPAAIAFTGARIVDSVVAAHAASVAGHAVSLATVGTWIAVEGALVAALAGTTARHLALPVAAARAARRSASTR